MENDDKLPRGHAYIRMRNRGYKIDIDYPELDSAQAERIIKAVMFWGTLPDGIDGAKPHPGHGVTIQYANGRTREVRS